MLFSDSESENLKGQPTRPKPYSNDVENFSFSFFLLFFFSRFYHHELENVDINLSILIDISERKLFLII